MTTKKKMTKAEMRVRIAKDVLAQVKADRLTPREQSYLIFRGALPVDSHGYISNEDVDVRDTLKGAKCQVCALGALFVAAVDRFNECQLPACRLSVGNRLDLTDYLAKAFSATQMDAIEAAFEGQSYAHGDRDRVYNSRFVDAYDDSTERLRAIMRNIVRNGGTFRPSEVRAPR